MTTELLLHLSDQNMFQTTGAHNSLSYNKILQGLSMRVKLPASLTSNDFGEQADAISFLDFSKAFDCMPEQRLLLKLAQLNLAENAFHWIQDFLKIKAFESHAPCVILFDYNKQSTKFLVLQHVVRFLRSVPSINFTTILLRHLTC